MPKIIINYTVNLFFFAAAISILVISNHNSFQVMFDKIVLFEKYSPRVHELSRGVVCVIQCL